MSLPRKTHETQIKIEPIDRRNQNIRVAQEAITYCRKIIPVDHSFTHPLVTNKKDSARLFKEVSAARTRKTKLSELVYQTLMYSHDDYLQKVKRTMKASKEFGVGNCGELSDLAMNFLRKKNIQRAERMHIVDSDHVFVVIDREGNIDDVTTWGKDCVILDILNNEIFSPAEIYLKLKCYRFDFNNNNPHIFNDFTPNNRLAVSGQISAHTDVSENNKNIQIFDRKLFIIAQCCSQYLDIEKYNELNNLLDKILSEDYKLNESTNFDLERLFDKKIKAVIKFIESTPQQDEIFNDILVSFLHVTYDSAALHIAIPLGQNKVVDGLLKMGVNPYEMNPQGLLPLHLAAKNGRFDLVKLLLDFDKDASINHRNSKDAWTALHYAVSNGHDGVVKELLKRGALPFLRDDEGVLPLHLAAKIGRIDLVNLLLDHTKDPSGINSQQRDGWTALHLAVFNGHFTIVNELLSRGADPNLTNHNDLTPFHLAVRTGYIGIVRLLLDHANNPSTINSQKKDGWTALHLAVYNGHATIVEELLRRGANPNLTNTDGSTPLHLAAKRGHVEILKLLLNQNTHANINHQNNNNWTALHLAVVNGSATVVNELLKRGADPQLTTNTGSLPLHLAARGGRIDVFNLLLDTNEKSINHQDKAGWTALHYAISQGHVTVVEELLKRGADTQIANQNGMTPLMLAEQMQKKEIFELIKNVPSSSQPTF